VAEGRRIPKAKKRAPKRFKIWVQKRVAADKKHFSPPVGREEV